MGIKSRRRLRIMMWILLSLVVVIAVGAALFLRQPSFGRIPGKERLARMEGTGNYSDGAFHNITPTRMMVSEKPLWKNLWDFIFSKVDDLRPANGIPSVKTDLSGLDPAADIVVWLGHSTVYMQLNEKRILVDPVLLRASPVSFINKPFPGADIFKPEDVPALDYILITHDHWDHLDYATVKVLAGRTGRFICGIGVGEHLERWGIDPGKIIEMMWNETADLDGDMAVHCLPARHFSGRGLARDKSLWVSFLLESPAGNVFISGDTGYDKHFKRIGEKFDRIDFAIMENGQYNEEWKDIHMMPEHLVQAVRDIAPERFITVHNSKYALARHPWYEPLENISGASQRDSLPLLTPMIGQPVFIKDGSQTFGKWWDKK